MSLTRAQWEDMWISATRIEELNIRIAKACRSLEVESHSARIEKEVNKIKNWIQEVIGQVE